MKRRRHFAESDGLAKESKATDLSSEMGDASFPVNEARADSLDSSGVEVRVSRHVESLRIPIGFVAAERKRNRINLWVDKDEGSESAVDNSEVERLARRSADHSLLPISSPRAGSPWATAISERRGATAATQPRRQADSKEGGDCATNIFLSRRRSGAVGSAIDYETIYGSEGAAWIRDKSQNQIG